jgi:hypothetical protein
VDALALVMMLVQTLFRAAVAAASSTSVDTFAASLPGSVTTDQPSQFSAAINLNMNCDPQEQICLHVLIALEFEIASSPLVFLRTRDDYRYSQPTKVVIIKKWPADGASWLHSTAKKQFAPFAY